jgi:hypothetical protein
MAKGEHDWTESPPPMAKAGLDNVCDVVQKAALGERRLLHNTPSLQDAALIREMCDL